MYFLQLLAHVESVNGKVIITMHKCWQVMAADTLDVRKEGRGLIDVKG